MRLAVSCLTALLLLSTACSSLQRSAGDPDFANQAEENLRLGDEALGNRDFLNAEKYFEFVKTKYPYLEAAKEAELKLGDVSFEQEQQAPPALGPEPVWVPRQGAWGWSMGEERLLAEARTLKDIIWIESQLTTRQAELDSLKSQATWLDDQTSQATITVDISRATGKADEPEDDEPAGFLAGLRGGMKALGASFATVATIAGALLPFAVVLGVLGLPVWLLVRRQRPVPAPWPTPSGRARRR